MWSNRATNPVIMDGQNAGPLNPANYGVMSTTAGRRSIFIGYKDPKGRPFNRAAICAEPPPDAIDALANAITVSASGGDGVNSAQAHFANSLAVSSALGLYRSQGLQLLRDQTFQLCIRAMITEMNIKDWEHLQGSLVTSAVALIEKEMPAIQAAAAKQAVVVTPHNPFPGTGDAKPATPAPQSPTPTGAK
jgi:hypothetical protein